MAMIESTGMVKNDQLYLLVNPFQTIRQENITL